MSFAQGIVLILSPFNTEDDFKKIYDIILNLDLKDFKSESLSVYDNSIPKKILEPYEAFNLSYEMIDINKCEGRISKEFITPYPPGIPLVCPGERIEKEAVNIIEDYIKNEKDILGVDKEQKKISAIIE